MGKGEFGIRNSEEGIGNRKDLFTQCALFLRSRYGERVEKSPFSPSPFPLPPVREDFRELSCTWRYFVGGISKRLSPDTIRVRTEL